MILNRKAYFNYNVLETFEAGMVLRGTEIKSIRLGAVNISNAYCSIQNGEIFLFNMSIARYKFSRVNHEELRNRKLLLKKREIKRLLRSQEKTFTIIPLEVYFNIRGYIKVKIGLCSGKKEIDKRRAIKERELKREAMR
jgi:SsrA-binding protein